MWMMLDSGAYSAWASNVSINLEDYIAYIKANSDYVDVAVNLDVIPGRPNVMPTDEELEASAQEGWDNLLRMEEEGIYAMPVYHQGEKSIWLERMLSHGCKYIGLSPANDRSTNAKIDWLDRVFAYLCNDKGIPCVKTHAFGATSVKIAVRYPWYSIDSTTWLATGSRFGMIMIPKPGKNGAPWSYDDQITRVFVSKESAAMVREGKVGFFTDGDVTEVCVGNINMLVPKEQDTVTRFVLESGYTLDDLAESRRARNVVNARFYKCLEDPHLRLPFRERKQYIFPDYPDEIENAVYPDHLEPLKVIFATNTTRQANEVLNEINATDRLLSYFYLKTMSPTWLREFIANGLGPDVKPRTPKENPNGKTHRTRL